MYTETSLLAHMLMLIWLYLGSNLSILSYYIDHCFQEGIHFCVINRHLEVFNTTFCVKILQETKSGVYAKNNQP